MAYVAQPEVTRITGHFCCCSSSLSWQSEATCSSVWRSGTRANCATCSTSSSSHWLSATCCPQYSSCHCQLSKLSLVRVTNSHGLLILLINSQYFSYCPFLNKAKHNYMCFKIVTGTGQSKQNRGEDARIGSAVWR